MLWKLVINKFSRIFKEAYVILVIFGVAYPTWCIDDQIHSLAPSAPSRKVVRILTIDGGGVRGIIPATILEGIEERIPAIPMHNGNQERPHLAEYFDIMAGTSTGGVIVLGLSAGIPAEELARLYLTNGERIFPPPGMLNFGASGPKYDASGLESVLEECLGDRWLKEAMSHVLIPADDLGQRCAYLFDSQEAGSSKSQNFRMRYVARATSAAPTYFRAATIRDEKEIDEHTYVDGGLYANDPTFEAIQAAEKNFPGCDFFILSLGTGETPRKFGDLSLANGGKLAWAQEIAEHLMERAQDRHLNVLKSLKSLMAQQGRTVNYHRIQVFIDPSISALDDVKSIPNLRQAGLFLLNPLNPTGVREEFVKVVQELQTLKEREEQALSEIL